MYVDTDQVRLVVACLSLLLLARLSVRVLRWVRPLRRLSKRARRG